MTGPEWITLSDAVDLWDEEVSSRGGALDGLAMSIEFTQALASGQFRAVGIRHDGMADPRSREREEISTLYFSAGIRTFRFCRIEAWSDLQSVESWRDNREYRATNPDWHSVHFHAASFWKWLEGRWPSDAAEAKPEPSDGDEAQIVPPVVKRKRGPKPKVDQEKFEKAVHEWIAENGMPNPDIDPNSRQADLERYMMSWHGDRLKDSRNRELVSAAMQTYAVRIATSSQ